MNNIQNTDHHPRPVLRVANAHRPRRPATRAVPVLRAISSHPREASR